SQIVSHIQQTLKQFARFFLSVEQVPAGDQPKGAWYKNDFTARQSVHPAFLRQIAHHETIFHQLPFDSLDGVADTLICCGQKTDEWHCQKADVQRIGAIKLGECLSLLAIPTLAYLPVYLLSNLSPAAMMLALLASAFLNKFLRAIIRDPRHHF